MCLSTHTNLFSEYDQQQIVCVTSLNSQYENIIYYKSVEKILQIEVTMSNLLMIQKVEKVDEEGLLSTKKYSISLTIPSSFSSYI